MDCKVFVGNIPLKADMEELKKIFEVHGKVVGMNMKNMKGFTFIHFESADIVKKAIAAEHGREFCNSNLNVKQAMKKEDMPANNLTTRVMTADNVDGEKPNAGGEKDGGKEWSGGGGGEKDGGKEWSGGGGDGGYPKHQPPPYNRGYQSGPPPTNQPPPNMGTVRPPRHHAPPYSHNQAPPHQRHQGPPPARHQGPPPSRYQGPPRHQGPPARHQGPPPGHHGSSQERAPPPTANQTPNDVEIICVMKNTRNWAEFIEGRLKNMGLRVDVLFPNPDISLGKVLGNIAMRGVMFAVCVAPDNERHRSLTVNVLQGEQQEHRNMPIDEAISFISRRYATFVEKGGTDKVSGKEEVTKVVTGGSLVAPEKVVSVGGGSFGVNKPAPASSMIPANTTLPKEVVNIIGFLMDDRAMSIMEYDRLIKFLVSRREATLKEEYGSNIPAHLLVPPVGPNQDPALKSTQEELQNRVIEILNKKQSLLKSQQQQQQQPDSSSVGLGGGGGGVGGGGTQGGSEVGAAPAIAPSLQQAIDSLVKTGPNLLASLTGGSYGVTATNNSSGSSGGGPAAGDHLPEANIGAGSGGGQLGRFYASMMDS